MTPKPGDGAGSPTPSPQDIERAERSLQALKNRLQEIPAVGGGVNTLNLLTAAADDCADGVIICDTDAKIRLVNGVVARITGLSTRELQSLTVWDITHGDGQAKFDVLWREFLRAGRQRGTYTLRGRNGCPADLAYYAEAHVLPHLHVSVVREPSAR